ncbi:MAG: hypothetical protein ABW223_10815 [Rariglobus sp.]
MIACLDRWQFRRGFRAAFSDARRRTSREIHAGSYFALGYQLGVSAYALSQSLETAIRDAEHTTFERNKSTK